MKFNFFLAFLFLAFVSAVIIANIDGIDLIGCTELNGRGCVCHTLDRDFSVSVWVEGPETLYVGQTGYFQCFMSGGPAEAGGYNVAGRFGEMVLLDSFSYQNQYALNELTQAFSLPFPSPQDTIYWDFGYTASDSSAEWDTIYSCGLSIVWDSIPDPNDRWNFGPKFPIRILHVSNTQESPVTPDNFNLYQNFPNPFNPTTKIQFTIPSITLRHAQSDVPVTLKVYDVLGNEVTTLVDEEKVSGSYQVDFNGTGLTSGIYFYRIEAGNYSETKKMVLLR
ncbi:MAG: T9SS type A sorting domain-containing protein [Ignavibacteriaceae bacterium]|nr:T9SS type A sorting domain-containing protein [Ignavibacteriaceae bacterium]